MTYEVDYIIKVVNTGATQAMRDMASAVNLLGPGVQVLDRLNKRIAALNKSISGKKRRLTIDTSPAEKSLTALESHVNRIQQKLHLISTMGGGKAGGGGRNSGGGRASSAQPRDMWKHNGSLYARGNQAPQIRLPKDQTWRRGMIPLEAFNAKELQMWRQIENQQSRLQKRMNQRASRAWQAAGGRTGTGMSKDAFARQYAQSMGLTEHTLWQQGNHKMRNLQRGWVNSYAGSMSSGGSAPIGPMPMPFTNSGKPSGGAGGRRVGGASPRPNNLGYKLFGPTPLTNNGGMAIDMLKGMGIAYGIAGIGQFMSNMVNDAVEYDNTMTTVNNILQANEYKEGFQSRYSRMQKTIRAVGKSTKFKVTEVADAARFLAMAGLQSDAISAAIPSIADIALIGDTDLGETADLVTNVMTAYNIVPRKMRNTADIMTRTFTRANVTLPEIAESYKYAGSLLSAGGIDFEEATAAIGVLGDAGIKGSQAGTTMRTLLSNITNPRGKAKKAKWKEVGISRIDKNGNEKSLNQIFNELYNKHLSVADYYRLFDKTAAQGAVALAMHVQKWNDVISENFMADGLSEKLADEKKNTIKGLWAQLTSALADDGLGGFGAIQENVKVLLRSITQYLNSEAGRDKVVEIFEVFWKFVDIIGNATTYLFSFFDKFSGIITFWMKVQLAIWPLVKTFTTLKSVLLAFSGIGRIVGFIGALSMNMRTLMMTMGSMKALGAVSWDWLASIMTGGLRARKYNLSTPGSIVSGTGATNYSSTWGDVTYTGTGNGGTVIYPNGVPTDRKPPKANGKFWRGNKGGAVGAGFAGMLGMGLGAYAGDKIGGYFNGEGSSAVGSIVGGVAGAALMTSAGSWLAGAAPALLTNPVGWAVLAVGALAAIGVAIWKTHKAIEAANAKSVEWAKTVHSLYLDQIDWSKDNAIETANLRVTQGLLSQNDALQAGIANWNAWWKARNGPEEKPSEFKPAETTWGLKMDQLLEDADRRSGRNDLWRNRWNTMFPGQLHGNTFSVPGISLTTDGKVSEEEAVKLAFMERGAAMGTDPNKEDYNPFYASAVNTLADKVWALENYGEWDSTVNTIIGNILPEQNSKYDNIDFDTAQKIKNNIMAVGSVKWYRQAALQLMKDEAAKYSGLVNVLNNYQTSGTADFSAMNKALYQLYNPYFSDTFGTFGTDEWKQNMVNYMHNADGRVNEQRLQEVLFVWERLNHAFDLLRPNQKGILAPYLQRDMWESILPEGTNLPDGGIASGVAGTYAYNNANQKFVRKAYTNAFGQQDLAWFRVNDDDTVAAKPYFGSDLISNIGASNVTRIGATGTFNPIAQTNEAVYPYLFSNGSVGLNPNFNWAQNPFLTLNESNSWMLPGFNARWASTAYAFNPPLLNGGGPLALNSADYKPTMVVQTDKPVAQGNQLVATNAVGTQNINVYVQGATWDDIRGQMTAELPGLMINTVGQAMNTGISNAGMG